MLRSLGHGVKTWFPFYSTLRCSTALCCSTLLYSTLLSSTLLYSTLLYSTLHYTTLLYSNVILKKSILANNFCKSIWKVTWKKMLTVCCSTCCTCCREKKLSDSSSTTPEIRSQVMCLSKFIFFFKITFQNQPTVHGCCTSKKLISLARFDETKHKKLSA